MIDVEIDLDVFNKEYIPHLNNMARTQIFFGGSGSGKSVFLAQRCIYDIMRGGRNYLVCRAVGRTIRGSVFTEIVKVISQWGLVDLFTVNKTDMLITCTNGQQIMFAGLDDIEKLKSLVPLKGVITDIWIEEATETDKNTVKQLYKRQRGGSDDTPKRLMMSFNPIMQNHWIYHEYFTKISLTDKQTEYKTDELSILKTWYIHNRFLTESDIQDLENETDQYFYQVYTLGNWGVLGHVIFTNWKVQDLSGMLDQFTNHRHGLDFGFSSDPAALWLSHYDRDKKTIYLYDELYQRGLTNDILADEIKKKIGHWAKNDDGEYVCNSTDNVTCDSAEPKSIAELKRHKVNAIGAKKGKDSVLHGIQWLQQQTIIIDAKCVNAKNEFMQYHWKEDKDGNAIRQPVDKHNHLIDAGRYALEDDALEAWVDVMENPFYD